MLTQPQFGDREIPCIYAEEGCAWVGRKRDVLSHLQHDCEWQDPLSRQKSFESEKKRRQSLHVLYTSICRDEATDIDDRRSFPLVETLGLKSFSWIDDDQDGLMSFDEFARGLDAMTDADRVRMDDICAILETLAEGHAVTASESKLVFDVLSGDGSRVSVQVRGCSPWPGIPLSVVRCAMGPLTGWPGGYVHYIALGRAQRTGGVWRE